MNFSKAIRSLSSSFTSRAVILLTRDHSVNETHQGYFAFAAIFYLVALTTSNTALQFISYPSQVIGKGLIASPNRSVNCSHASFTFSAQADTDDGVWKLGRWKVVSDP